MKEDFIQNRFGYCFYDLNKDPVLIYNLYVHHEYRFMGKAKRLLRCVINEIREIGYKGEIEIEPTPREKSIDLASLVSFYEKMGLKIRGS